MLLANRIALLKKEELRACKKISATKKRADEIMSLRAENEKKNQERTSAGEKQAKEMKKQQAEHRAHDQVSTLSTHQWHAPESQV